MIIIYTSSPCSCPMRQAMGLISVAVGNMHPSSQVYAHMTEAPDYQKILNQIKRVVPATDLLAERVQIRVNFS